MMVQIIDENRQGYLDRLGAGAAAGATYASQLMPQIMKMKKEAEYEKNEEALAKKLGIDVKGQRPELRQKLLTEGVKYHQKLAHAQKDIEALEKARGLEKGSLSDFITPSLAEKTSKPSTKTQAAKPIDPEQLKIIKDVRSTPQYQAANSSKDIYTQLTDAGVSKENAEAEAKLFAEDIKAKEQKISRSFELQKDFIDTTTQQNRAYQTEFKPRLLQMQSLASDEDLIGAGPAAILEELGVPLGVLGNPSNEVYSKLSQDLLKGLPETYGNRILKVEVENFLKTIPTLLNTPNGRRMIASNMLKLGEMKEVFYKEMRRQQMQIQDENKAYPADFEQRIFDQVQPQIEQINQEFQKLIEIKDVPKGEVPFFDPEGQIKFIPKDKIEWATKHRGKRIW